MLSIPFLTSPEFSFYDLDIDYLYEIPNNIQLSKKKINNTQYTNYTVYTGAGGCGSVTTTTSAGYFTPYNYPATAIYPGQSASWSTSLKNISSVPLEVNYSSSQLKKNNYYYTIEIGNCIFQLLDVTEDQLILFKAFGFNPKKVDLT